VPTVPEHSDRTLDADPLGRRFLTEYRQVFAAAEAAVRGVPRGESRRSWTQRLLHRLLLAHFLRGNGWGPGDGNGREAHLPRAVLARVEDLFGRYPFTLRESPADTAEVGIDPGILGSVFEELVPDRHRRGSYFTPRGVVSFMCREALKGYLGGAVSGGEAVRFVDGADAAVLSDPAAAAAALGRVRVCDPACGCGAFLLGMLHELLRLDRALGAGGASLPGRKRAIIAANLYGVDRHPSAVAIARDRLWLSLLADADAEEAPPPALERTLLAGDSLTGPGQCRTRGEGFDWHAAFPDVFAAGGFDIVVTNPPFVRSELLDRAYKEGHLRRTFPDVYHGRADLYVYFYALAQRLLRPGGVGCFVSSNRWLRAGYGEGLRRRLLDDRAVRLVVDFGELPLFAAGTFPAIVLWHNHCRGRSPTRWAAVRDLRACHADGLRAHVDRVGESLPARQFVPGGDRLLRPDDAARRAAMRRSGPCLAELAGASIFYGIKTGLNPAFLIDRATRDRLVAEDPRSAEVIKPLLRGDHIRRYEIHFRELYLIFTRQGIDLRRYPAVRKHLERFRADLTPKESRSDGPGRKPGRYAWYEIQDAVEYHEVFERPKILYPVIGRESRFVRDDSGHYANDKAFLLPGGDWYLLGVLNSAAAFDYLKGTCSVLGDENHGGRLEFRKAYLQTLPVPEAAAAQRVGLARLARRAQELHTARRRRVERLLLDLGTAPADLARHGPLERPWLLTPVQFGRRVRGGDLRSFTAAREETEALTATIARVEQEIDSRVSHLYGLG
jgi:hypothetical protein